MATAAAWDEAAATIYTWVTIDVVKSWGLSGAPSRVVVKQLGGIVGDTAFVVGGQAQFEVGEDVLVFLDVRPRDNTLSVAGLEQGKWVLTGSPDPSTSAARDVRGHDITTVVSRDYTSAVTLDQLAALVGTTSSATGAVLQPAVPAALASADGRRGPAYTLLTSQPARWHQPDDGLAVFVDTQSGGHPQFSGGGLTQLANANAMWSAAGSLRLVDGVSRTARCFNNTENDGRISVTYGDPCGEISDASSTLAIGGAWYSSADIRTVNGVNYWKMLKGMIIIDNPPTKFSSFTTGCYEELLVHELGHTIGFGHAAARPAIMFPSLSSGCFSRTVSAPLGADDLAAMAAVYPGAGAPPPPPPPPSAGAPGAPGGVTWSVSGSTVTVSWTAPPTGGTPTGYQVVAGSTPGASNYGAIPVVGTSMSAGSVPQGTYYVRVVATNAAGTSAASSEVAVVVGGAPQAPRSFVATSTTRGVANLSWLAPASGPTPTSYVVLAGPISGSSSYQIPVAGTSFASGGVPAGTYFVRVVALNGAAASAPSAEVVLVVQ